MRDKLIRIFASLLLVSGFVNVTAASSFHTHTHLKSSNDSDLVPLLVLIQFNPWREAYGSDSPDFVLYEDGTVIYFKRDKNNEYPGRYVSTKLTDKEKSQLLEGTNRQAFYSFDNDYDPQQEPINEGKSIIRTVSDLPNRFILLRKPDGSYKKVSIYGYLEGELDSDYLERNLKGNKSGFVVGNAPKALIDALRYIYSYDAPQAKEWWPEYYEVVIWPFTDDSKKTLMWPKGLPDLSDSKSIKHKKYYRQSLFVNHLRKKDLFDVIWRSNKGSSRAAIRINGQRWSAEVRTPFPSENVWLEITGHKFRE